MRQRLKRNFLLIVIAILSLLNVQGQNGKSTLYYNKRGFITKTHVLLIDNDNKYRITVIKTVGLSAYNVLINSNLTKTDTIINEVNVILKSNKDSAFVFKQNDNYYVTTNDFKRIKLKLTNIESDKLRELWRLFPNLDKLVKFDMQNGLQNN